MNVLSEYGIFPKIVVEKNENRVASMSLCTVSFRQRSPITGLEGPEGSRRLRLTDFKSMGT
jgi:hypothetical protein